MNNNYDDYYFSINDLKSHPSQKIYIIITINIILIYAWHVEILRLFLDNNLHCNWYMIVIIDYRLFVTSEKSTSSFPLKSQIKIQLQFTTSFYLHWESSVFPATNSRKGKVVNEKIGKMGKIDRDCRFAYYVNGQSTLVSCYLLFIYLFLEKIIND